MLTAVVSGSRAQIFAHLLYSAQKVSAENGNPVSISNEKYQQLLDAMHGRRISHTITLSREN